MANIRNNALYLLSLVAGIFLFTSVHAQTPTTKDTTSTINARNETFEAALTQINTIHGEQLQSNPTAKMRSLKILA